MAKWTFEPGHTAAEFCARHMMVTYVRGHFKNIHGTLDFDPAHPEASSVEVVIDATTLWTGEPDRDAHLRSSDFLDVEAPAAHFPQSSSRVDRRARLPRDRRFDDPRGDSPGSIECPVFGAVANTLV